MPDISDLVAAAARGERQPLARLLSIAERGGRLAFEIENLIAPMVGQAWTVGITGPPGAGKSTLINALLPLAQQTYGKAAVLAVDPSSPFSDGAILGDRVRMQGGQYGSSVFIRSMASRGEIGGLAMAASTSVRLFDAARWPIVMIETLGIGQVELDIMNLADTVIVVLNPGWGDEFQANKAGITEAGDIFVVNKADRPGAQQTRIDLLNSLSLLSSEHKPGIVETVASTGEGVEALWEAIQAHQTHVRDSGSLDQLRASRRRRMVHKTIKEHIAHVVEAALSSDSARDLVADVTLGEVDLGTTVENVVAMLPDYVSYK